VVCHVHGDFWMTASTQVSSSGRRVLSKSPSRMWLSVGRNWPRDAHSALAPSAVASSWLHTPTMH
jgi:hypothetical protein